MTGHGRTSPEFGNADFGSRAQDITVRLEDLHARERQFWDERANEQHNLVRQPVPMEVFNSRQRRPWHSYWTLYDRLLAQEIRGLRTLVVGSGYGDDAIRLALGGAAVTAFDLCPGAVEIAKQRARNCHELTLPVFVAAVEKMPFESKSFDLVLVNAVLHHCAFNEALAEIARVVRLSGKILIREPYMHSKLQKIRHSYVVRRLIGHRGASQDERPLNENHIRLLRATFSEFRVAYLHGASGRVIPEKWQSIVATEGWLHARLPWLGAGTAAAIVAEAEPRDSDIDES